MARTVNKAALEEKIRKLEGAIRKNREQYDRLTADLDELLAKRRAIQSEELMKAIAESPRSYNEILQYIKGETSDDSDAEV
jgi:molecular chaperone GrpE (heat shock protein)